MSSDPLPAANRPASSKLRGWGEALGITLVGILLGGVGCFILLRNYLYRQVQEGRMDLFHAAAWWEVGFGVIGLVLIPIFLWQLARGSSLAELGWRKPAPPLAYVLAVGLAILFLTGSYFGAQRVLPDVNVLEVNGLRLALAPLGIFLAIGEEMMMRGFFMTALHRAG